MSDEEDSLDDELLEALDGGHNKKKRDKKRKRKTVQKKQAQT